jgi:hypothetical protein
LSCLKRWSEIYDYRVLCKDGICDAGGGRETWNRLRDWDKGQTDSERLSARILNLAGFKEVDPIHPRGGKDGGKDIICIKDGIKFIGACYFPRGQKDFSDILKKFEGDLKGVSKNGASGMAFITNQELKNSERKKLEKKLVQSNSTYSILKELLSSLTRHKAMPSDVNFLILR